MGTQFTSEFLRLSSFTQNILKKVKITYNFIIITVDIDFFFIVRP